MIPDFHNWTLVKNSALLVYSSIIFAFPPPPREEQPKLGQISRKAGSRSSTFVKKKSSTYISLYCPIGYIMHLPGQFGPFSARWGDSERVENGGEHQRPDGRKASSPTRECSKIEVFRIWSVQNIDRLIQPGVLSQRGEAETAAGSEIGRAHV